MAIAPEVLAKQRIGRTETACARCGERTTDKTGTHLWCRVNLPDVGKMPAEALLKHYEAARAEIARRRDALTKVLEDA